MFNSALKLMKIWVFFALSALFFACSSASKNQSVHDAKQVSDSAPLDGIWVGEFDIRGRGPYDFTAVQLEDKAFAYSLKAKAMCIGTYTFDGEHTLHKYVLFALDGGPFDWATLTGTVADNEVGEKQILSHFKTLNGGDTGALNITYHGLYEQPSSLDFIEGNWSYTDRDELTTTISIDKQGVLLGDDSDQCRISGHVKIINSKFNAYHLDMNIAECGSTSGDYEGVAFLDQETFTIQIANPQYALHYLFNKN